MPPDVFCMLSLSGISLIGALLFFVSEERPRPPVFDDPRLWVTYCLPPHHAPARAREPKPRACSVMMPFGRLELSCEQEAESWVFVWVSPELGDSPAMRVVDDENAPVRGSGQVHDLRWNGRAGVALPKRVTWRSKPGRA